VRLDRLLDLLDAARFGGPSETREAMWDALGGHATDRGPEATREALTRLLQEALALEERASLRDDTRRFVRDAITLLTTDLETPGSADDLAVRTLAYRTLAADGHARVRDNAQWRLYDHVRGTLVGALAAGPESRTDVAVQALYAERESVERELADAPVHERPPWIGADALAATLARHREALAGLRPWQPLVATRAKADDELRRTVLATLPAARDREWALALRPRGTGAPESFAPVLRVAGGRAEVDAGRPQHRTFSLADADVAPLADALRASLAQDGRGVVLLAVDPEAGGTDVHRVLRALRRAHAARVEIALREPHAQKDVGTVVTALPLEIVHGRGDGAGALAIASARVHAHVAANGVVFTHDGRVLATAVRGPELTTMLDRVARAYPRERTLRVTIADDAPLALLIDLLVGTSGGTSSARDGGPAPRWSAVGWLPDDAEPTGKPSASAESALQMRAELASSRSAVRIDQPFPLAGDDQKRLQTFAEQLWRCVPELELNVPASKTLELEIVFEGGRAHAVTAKPIAKVPAARLNALRACVEDEALGLRLREHRDRLAIGIGLVAGK
jgi:hypothetical protein